MKALVPPQSKPAKSAPSTPASRQKRSDRYFQEDVLHQERELQPLSHQRSVPPKASGEPAVETSPRSEGMSWNISRIPIAPPAPARAPVQAKLTVNQQNDRYEQEADRIAAQITGVEPPRPPAPVYPGLQRKPAADTAQAQPVAPGLVHKVIHSPARSLDPATRAYMEPRFGYDFSEVRIHTGGDAGQSARAIRANAYTAGNNIVFGPGRYAPGTLSGNRLLAHELTHVIQQSAAPSAVIQRDSSELDQRRDEIHQLEEHHARHDKVDGTQEEEAKLRSIGTLQKIFNKLSGATGTETNAAVSELMRNMDSVKNARYRGYGDAIAELALKLSDPDPASGGEASFLLSLAGNLLWALSGLIAITPAGLEAKLAVSLAGAWGKGVDVAPLVQKLVAVYNRRRAFLSVAAGTAGAMLAQFSNGLPSTGTPGSKVSNGIIEVKHLLDQVNTSLFADMELQVYDAMLTYVDFNPKPSLGATHLAARMIQGVRAVMLSGYVESGRVLVDDASRIDEAGIQQDARDSVLRMWLLQSAGLRDGHLAATNLTQNGSDRKPGEKLVASAVELQGGEEKLNLQRYELVYPKLRQAASIFGCQVNIDEKAIEYNLMLNKPVVIPVASWDPKKLTPASLYALWEQNALTWDQLDTSGDVPPIGKIYSLEIRAQEFSSMTIKGRTVYSLDKVTFHCRSGYGGAAAYNSDFEMSLFFDSTHEESGNPPVKNDIW